MGVEVDQRTGLFILAGLVVLLGLPHGALDYEVARSLNLVKSIKSAAMFGMGYLIIAAVGIAFWFAIPWLGLSMFLIISALHFSSDWRDALPFTTRICTANIILSGPTVIYQEQVISLFNALLVAPEHSIILAHTLRYVFFVSALILCCVVVLKKVNKPSAYVSKTLSSELACLVLCSVIVPPLVHFILYFCFLHSPKHLSDVANSLRLSKLRAILYSLPFVILTLVLAYVASWFLSSNTISVDVLRWVFIGLFGLTLAHMCLIHLWHSHN